jgi:DNA-binding protein H-NS
MAQTYKQLTAQIAKLSQQAENVRQSEMAGVIERIKSAIEAYNLTPEQLFDASPSVAAKRSGAASSGKSAPAKKRSQIRFRDSDGNSWSGRGPRPGWVREALAAGGSLDQFAVDGGSQGKTAAKSSGPSAKTRSAAKYKDDAGNSWSGRGPQPRWLKALLAQGRDLADLAA